MYKQSSLPTILTMSFVLAEKIEAKVYVKSGQDVHSICIIKHFEFSSSIFLNFLTYHYILTFFSFPIYFLEPRSLKFQYINFVEKHQDYLAKFQFLSLDRPSIVMHSTRFPEVAGSSPWLSKYTFLKRALMEKRGIWASCTLRNNYFSKKIETQLWLFI
jgi:hypothetical protein